MSLFKEKDDYLVKAFSNQFENSDEDSVSEKSDNGSCDSKRQKLEEPSEDELKKPDEQCQNETVEVTQKEKSLESIHSPNVVEINDSPEVICLQSDDDDDYQTVAITNEDSSTLDNSPESAPSSRLNISQDLDDFEYNLKMMIAGDFKKFPTTYNTPLHVALKDFVRELESRNRNLVVTFKGVQIALTDSPRDLKLTIGDILNAVEVGNKSKDSTEMINPNDLVLKLQDGNRKHTKEYKISKNEPIIQLKKLYATEFGIDNLDRIKLRFDGDNVEDEVTLEELDAESGDTFDVVLM